MRKIILPYLLLINIVSFCQPEDSTMTAARKRQIEDSLTAVLKDMGDKGTYIQPVPGADSVQQNVNPGLDYFIRMQEREKAEQKKTAALRIILGVLLLGILIIGLTRKVKK